MQGMSWSSSKVISNVLNVGMNGDPEKIILKSAQIVNLELGIVSLNLGYRLFYYS